MAKHCVRGRVYPQFDGHPLGSRNCAVSVGRSLVTSGSRGTVKPSASEMRKRAGGTTAWWTPLHVKKAVESYDQEMRKRGMKPLKYRLAGRMSGNLFVSGASRQSLVAAVKREDMVHVVVDYAVTNDEFPALSGSSGFRDRHAIWVGGKKGWRNRNGHLEVKLGDSTWGRTGTPKATPKWVRFGKVWKMADGAWSSRGGRGWVGGSVACSPLLQKPKPPPPPKPDRPEDPPGPCEDAMAELEDELEAAREQLADAQALIDELRTRIPDAEVLERLRELRDDIDELLPVIDDTSPVEPGVEVPQ